MNLFALVAFLQAFPTLSFRVQLRTSVYPDFASTKIPIFDITSGFSQIYDARRI